MATDNTITKNDIVVFNGKLSGNLLVEPHVSNSYMLEDGDKVIIFDPSCGKTIAKKIEAHIETRRKGRNPWNKAAIIAGHSHIDHANNFYLIDLMGAKENHAYVHERGFENGRVKNEPVSTIDNSIIEAKKYYNVYLSYSFPYNLLMYPMALIDSLSPYLARKMFSYIGAVPWPRPVDGSVKPEPLKESDLQDFTFGNVKLKGWALDNMIILPTPGHSPCSVSLFWPEKRALFISDADWIGNPVFVTSSIKDCISSFKIMRDMTEAELVDVLLPAHGTVKEGKKIILTHLDFHIHRLEALRNEVLSTYYNHGQIKDVRKLTSILTESPHFKALKILNYPRLVVFVHTITAVCLREEGILA